MYRQSNSQSESGKLEQIVSQFLLKILHVVLDSRIPSIHRHDRIGDLSSVYRVKKSDKWFNLVLGDRPTALDNLNFWHRNLMDPMIIEIILVHQAPTSTETVIERWVVQYESPQVMAGETAENSASYRRTYKKSIILLRSLYSFLRLLPAHRIFRKLYSCSQNFDFDLIYKVSSFSNPIPRADEEKMKEFFFIPVEALPGRLYVSLTYRPTLSNFNLEASTALPPKIIIEYVGSPSTDPKRSFPSSEKGLHATSFPFRGIRPSSTTFHSPHSWTSGFHKAVPFTQNQPVRGSPPAYHTSPLSDDFSSSQTDNYGHRAQNYRLPAHQKFTSYEEYQFSPPFSPSSFSSRTYSPNSYIMQSHIRYETAPVTIPSPITGRSFRYLSPDFSDPNKHALPPLSPSSTKHDPSSQESPSGNHSYMRTESLGARESQFGVVNHYSGQKVTRDNKDDSGRFSGMFSSSGSPRFGFSRSSGRLSFQDDLDDCDFSCPFDVDDVDTSDSPASEHIDGKKASEFTSQWQPIGRKSQDAAVGVLVHMLRTAPPLCQDPSCYSSHSLRAEVEEGDGTASGFFIPRRTVDALKELKNYREMKDLLLSKSGTQVVSREEA